MKDRSENHYLTVNFNINFSFITKVKQFLW
jgi:hypothetical protein